MTKEELKRWGFSQREDGRWYNGHLCMILENVYHHLLQGDDIDEYDLIHAIYEHGIENGRREIQCQLQEMLGIDE